MQLKCLIEVMGTFGEKQSFGSGIDLKYLVFPAVHAWQRQKVELEAQNLSMVDNGWIIYDFQKKLGVLKVLISEVR